MDNSFNSLLRSYSDNYIQFKVTGNKRYADGYTSAQQGLDNIISQMDQQNSSNKQSLADFYKSGVEQRLTNASQQKAFLGRNLIEQKDEATAAMMRQSGSFTPTIQTWQYIALGVLGATAIGLSVI